MPLLSDEANGSVLAIESNRCSANQYFHKGTVLELFCKQPSLNFNTCTLRWLCDRSWYRWAWEAAHSKGHLIELGKPQAAWSVVQKRQPECTCFVCLLCGQLSHIHVRKNTSLFSFSYKWLKTVVRK